MWLALWPLLAAGSVSLRQDAGTLLRSQRFGKLELKLDLERPD